MLARNYEEAMALYTKYSDNVLGVISDVRFPIDGVKDSEAGLKLLRNIHKDNPYLPLIVESTESANREKAEAEGFRFVDKNSKKMSIDLRAIMEEHMGFGDFIFRDPKTKAEIMRIHSLKELQDNIIKIPDDIWNLGMIYKIDVKDDGTVDMDMTFTAPSCPAADFILEDVRTKVEGVKGVKSANVNLVFEPAWDQSMMSDEARTELGFD